MLSTYTYPSSNRSYNKDKLELHEFQSMFQPYFHLCNIQKHTLKRCWDLQVSNCKRKTKKSCCCSWDSKTIKPFRWSTAENTSASWLLQLQIFHTRYLSFFWSFLFFDFLSPFLQLNHLKLNHIFFFLSCKQTLLLLHKALRTVENRGEFLWPWLLFCSMQTLLRILWVSTFLWSFIFKHV